MRVHLARLAWVRMSEYWRWKALQVSAGEPIPWFNVEEYVTRTVCGAVFTARASRDWHHRRVGRYHYFTWHGIRLFALLYVAHASHGHNSHGAVHRSTGTNTALRLMLCARQQ